MIVLHRIDNTAVKLIIDNHGLKQLLTAFQEALHLGCSSIHVRFDPSLLSSRRGLSTEERVEVVRASVSVPTFVRGEHGVSWVLGIEDLESGAEQLTRALEFGYFSPSEFLRVQAPKRKKLDWIYAECALGTVDES